MQEFEFTSLMTDESHQFDPTLFVGVAMMPTITTTTKCKGCPRFC